MEPTTPTILAAVTLAVFASGGIATAVVWIRRGGAFAGLLALFVLGAARQVVALLGGVGPSVPPPVPTSWLTEIAFLSIALCALVALRALQRTTAERDRVEDLHWGSMESVRNMSELSARGGGDFASKLTTLLELGAARFRLGMGIAWLRDADGGRVLALHVEDDEGSQEVVATLEPQLQQTAGASGPLSLALEAGDGRTRAYFAIPLRLAGKSRGTLAFVGEASSSPGPRFGASDKDLLGLMAQWLAAEIERSERGEPSRAAKPRPMRARGASDLNEAVRATEPRLRRAVGTDATLAIDLDPDLPDVRPGGVPLPRLVESLVLAAARLAPTGRISLETRVSPTNEPPLETRARPDVMLVVRVDDPSLDGDALDRIFASTPDPTEGEPGPHGIPLPRLERWLKRSECDLSASLEPGRRVTLTAFLPSIARTQQDEVAPPPVQPSR